MTTRRSTPGFKSGQVLRIPKPARVSLPADLFKVCRLKELDPWLFAEVTERANLDDPWNNTVIVGMCARLVEGPIEWTREVVRKIMVEHKPVEELAFPRRWARKLTKRQLDTIESFTMASIDMAHALLDTIEDNMDCDNEGWWMDILRLCQEREELECVDLLLREAGRTRIRSCLEALDREGSRLVASIPVRHTFDDELLRRSAQREQDLAWWCRMSDYLLK